MERKKFDDGVTSQSTTSTPWKFDVDVTCDSVGAKVMIKDWID